MAHKVILPKQGLQMTEGTILKWIVPEGGECKENEPLFEMETDKLTITIDSPATGKLLKIIRGEGETVPITEIIAVIGEDGEDISSYIQAAAAAPLQAAAQEAAPQPEAAYKAAPAAASDTSKVFATPRAKMRAEELGIDYKAAQPTGPDGLIVERDVLEAKATAPKATPLAKKVAELNGVDIASVSADGKITKADVERMLRKPALQGAARTGKVIPFAGMRKVIAARMVESLQTAAQLTHSVHVDMTEATRLRESLKAANKKVSFNDIIAYATCRALLEYPMMNSEITPEGILIKDYVNLGIAVALDEGLIVPNVKDADLYTLEGLSLAIKELADKAKTGKLKPDEYKGGSFTLSNLGMFGLDYFTAIINPPESGILAVGKIEKKPKVVGDDLIIRPMMTITLTYDHRVADGAPAAQFLVRIKELLENPYLLL